MLVPSFTPMGDESLDADEPQPLSRAPRILGQPELAVAALGGSSYSSPMGIGTPVFRGGLRKEHE
jgi:hypothetical protein